MKLGGLQQDFFSLATRAQGVSSEAAQSLVRGTSRLSAAQRMDIYANMYLWRQVDSLREDFPKLVLWLGDESFFSLCEGYVRAHPSRNPSITHLGRALPEYLKETRGPGPEADLAALEWARSEAFDEADVLPAPAALLAQVSPEQLPSLILRFVPAHRLLRLNHDVVTAGQTLEAGEPFTAPMRSQPSPVVVWRKDYRVFHVALSLDEAAALELALVGAPLGDVCEAFTAREDALTAALAAVGSWFSEGWIDPASFTGVS